MEYIDKIVDFSYCKKCEHKDLKDYKDPCNECLNTPTRPHSIKPINYLEKKTKKKTKK